MNLTTRRSRRVSVPLTLVLAASAAAVAVSAGGAQAAARPTAATALAAPVRAASAPSVADLVEKSQEKAPSERRWDGAATTPGVAAATAAPGVAAAVALPPDGSFIRRDDGKVFQLVGGAPLYVSSWRLFGGEKRVTPLSVAQANLLREWPRDGTFVTSIQTGEVWRFVAGTPLYVSTWSIYGGVQKTIRIDHSNIVNAGGDDPYLATNWDPSYVEFVTGAQTFVRAAQNGRIYVFAGGAPQYVPTWSVYGGVKPFVTVDQRVIDLAGSSFRYDFLLPYPFDGWALRTPEDGRLYVTAGGAPLYTTTTSVLIPGQRASTVASAVFEGGRTGAYPYTHLRYVPEDGTELDAAGVAYTVFAGVPEQTFLDPGQFAVPVDPRAVANAGQPKPWDHLVAPVG